MPRRLTLAATLLCASAALSSAARTLPDVVDDYFQLQNQKECEAWGALFSPTFSVVDPLGAKPVTSLDALVAGCKGGAAVFPVINVEPTQVSVVPGQGTAAVSFHVSSVVNATTGCSLDFNGIDVLRVDSGLRIVSVIGYYNSSVPQHQVAACQS